MILSEQTKQAIKDDYNNWFNQQYGTLTKEQRDELGAVYTPAEVTIQMIERFETVIDKDILDPCCGSGNLLVGCILAGADPKRIYGNEFTKEMTELCRERLSKFGVPKDNIHQGDATDKYCLTTWGPEYIWPKKQLKNKVLW